MYSDYFEIIISGTHIDMDIGDQGRSDQEDVRETSIVCVRCPHRVNTRARRIPPRSQARQWAITYLSKNYYSFLFQLKLFNH